MITVADGPDEPDCSTCEYDGNIGYVKSAIYCQVFYMVSTLHTYVSFWILEQWLDKGVE